MALAIKRLKDPLDTMKVLQSGGKPSDVGLSDEINVLLRRRGFFSLEHFFEIVLNHELVELEEYNVERR
jgi:hypothetical protein